MAVLLSSFGSFAQKENNSMIQYKKIQVEDCRVFYREAGDASKTTILLLHGFPSSSHIPSTSMPRMNISRVRMVLSIATGRSIATSSTASQESALKASSSAPTMPG